MNLFSYKTNVLKGFSFQPGFIFKIKLSLQKERIVGFITFEETKVYLYKNLSKLTRSQLKSCRKDNYYYYFLNPGIKLNITMLARF